MQKYYKYCFFILTVALLAGCASELKPVAMDPDVNPASEINTQENQLNEARAQQVDLLAPGNFKAAIEHWDNAKNELNKNPKKSLKEIGYSKSYLDKAEQIANGGRAHFESVLSARAEALSSKANELMPKEFSQADHEFKLLGIQMEKGKLKNDFRDLAALRADYIRSDIQAIKKAKLGESYSLIKRAQASGAQRITPMTYQQARMAVVNAEQTIESEKNNTARIDEAAKRALMESEKLTAVLSYAKSAGGREAEKLAIQMYAQKLQSQQLSAKINEQAKSGKKTLAQLQAANNEYKGLKNRAELQDKIDELRKEFKVSEAEVLQEGNQVIFRLKSIQFGTANADLPSRSLATLAKVKNAVGELNPEKVIVQGHTDSTGSKTINQKVSEERAETVKQYLVTEDIPENKIVTEGLWFSKPLATNKTKQGRAQNRRVDVIVVPVGLATETSEEL